MAKRKKQTAAQRAYNKERNRIKRFIKSAEKRGYEIDSNVLPEPPKRITQASVRRLKKITPDTLYNKARYIDRDTGEVLSGKAGRNLERQKAAQKAAQTRKRKKKEPPVDISDVIIQNFINYMTGFPTRISQPILEWLRMTITKYGKQAVAYMLENNNVELSDYLNRTGYDSDGAAIEYCMALLDFLPGGGEGIDRAALNEAAEENEFTPVEDGDWW